MKRFTIPALVAALASVMMAAPQGTAPKSTGKAPAASHTTPGDAKATPAKVDEKGKTPKVKKNKHKEPTK
jgi:hypothetical protein